jgi:GR25 family glycosyltransferase involved in LPS biosynthesis
MKLDKENIFCISLKDSTNRNIFANNAKIFGINFSFFDAIDAKKFKVEDENLDTSKNLEEEIIISYDNLNIKYYPHKINYINNMTSNPKSIGCSISHCILYENLLNSNNDYFLIFEDDFVFSKKYNIKDIISDLKDVPDNFDVVFFSPSHAHKQYYSIEESISNNIYKLRQKINYFSGTSMYLISKIGAEKILKIQNSNTYSFAADDIFSFLSCNHDTNFYATYKLYGFGHVHVWPEMKDILDLI